MSDFIPETVAAVPGEIGTTNRGHDTAFIAQDAPQIKITLEKINEIIMNYITDVIQPTISENEAVRPVPVIYGTPERWATVRKDGVLRDPASSKLLTPLIMLRRTGEKKGVINNPNNKYLYSAMDAGWNRRNAYDKFAVLNGIRPSQQLRHVVIPDYIDLTYDVILWTEYQAQLDGLIEQINFESDEFWGNRNNWKFRVKIEQYQAQTDLPTNEDRVCRSQFQMTVAAYLLPEKMVKNFRIGATDTKVYTAKKVVTFVEAVNDINKLD